MKGQDRDGERRLDAVVEQFDGFALARFAVDLLTTQGEARFEGTPFDGFGRAESGVRRLGQLSGREHAEFRRLFARAAEVQQQALLVGLPALMILTGADIAADGLGAARMAASIAEATEEAARGFQALLDGVTDGDGNPVMPDVASAAAEAKRAAESMARRIEERVAIFREMRSFLVETLAAADQVRRDLGDTDPIPRPVREWITSAIQVLDQAGPTPEKETTST